MGQTPLENYYYNETGLEQQHQESIYQDQMDHSFSTLVMDDGSDQSTLVDDHEIKMMPQDRQKPIQL